ncbi:hypothetical protein Chor_003021 [Crotalus horridus]
MHKSSSLADVLKLSPPKVRKQDSIRKKTLDVLFFQAVRDLLNTPLVGQELYNLSVEVFKASTNHISPAKSFNCVSKAETSDFASLTSDFSTCRIYWKSSGNAEKDEHIQQILQRKASYIRHLLISYRIRVNVPSVIFVRDREEEAIREFTIVVSYNGEERSIVADTHVDPSIHTNLFGIDHEALNKQIMEYKKMKKKEVLEGTSVLETQLAEIRQHQKKMRWKKARKTYDDDLNPEEYLMERYSKDYWDSEVSPLENEELEYKPEEDGNELEKEK